MLERDAILKTAAALRSLRNNGQISEDVYCKEVVKLASEFHKIHDSAEALMLLRSLPSDYFGEPQLQQMLEDEAYCELAYALAEALLTGGYLDEDMGDDIVPNVPSGIA